MSGRVRRFLRYGLVTAAVLLVLGVLGAVGFIYSGVYNIAASQPHSRVVQLALTTLQQRSVAMRADIALPSLEDPELVQAGLALYRAHCVVCHGAPGEARGRIGVGLNPNPPPLEQLDATWTDAGIHWVISRGLKMAGMPAFGLGRKPGDLFALTAFVRRMQTLSPDEYRLMVAVLEERVPPEGIAWVTPDLGWTRMRESGSAERGRALIGAFGCGSCHAIADIPGAQGGVGPPLSTFGRRRYVAGRLTNAPDPLVEWIIDPPAIDPGTLMPNLGVTREQALDIAAYLHTLR